MKKNAFTLIELLAVIIILAIIALIATPIILNVIEDAKISAGKSEANMILSGINNYCATETVKEEMNSNYEVVCKSGLMVEDVKKMVNLGNSEILEMDYTTRLIWLKVKSNGHIYSLQGNTMVEGDFGKPKPSFAEDSWETIAENVRNGIMYSVGEEKEIKLTGTYAGTYKVRIANNTTPEECEIEEFSQTACGFVIEFVDIITEYSMNTSITNKNGWPGSEIYSFINNDVYNALPSQLKSIIIETKSVSGHGSRDMSNFTSNDRLYFFSTKEVWGGNDNYNSTFDSAMDETRQLDYYKKEGITGNSYSGTIKNYQENKSRWWLRTATSNDNSYFYGVLDSGYWHNFNAALSLGVAPAFRIG